MITRSKRPVVIKKSECKILQNFSGRKKLSSKIRLPNPTVRIRNRMVDYVFRHNERAALLGRIVAKKMGLSSSDQKIVEYSILLHDIGKGFLEPYIVHAPRKLTRKEFERMKKHTAYGRGFIEGDLLQGHPLASLIAETSYYHHETIGKGKGYYGTDSKRFGLHTKICQVVEVADAILSKRNYKKRQRISFLVRELKKGKKSGQFDPRIVNVFIEALTKNELGIGEGILDYRKAAKEMHDQMVVLDRQFRDQLLTTKSRARILDKGGRAARLINQRRRREKGEKHDPISNYY